MYKKMCSHPRQGGGRQRGAGGERAGGASGGGPARTEGGRRFALAALPPRGRTGKTEKQSARRNKNEKVRLTCSQSEAARAGAQTSSASSASSSPPSAAPPAAAAPPPERAVSSAARGPRRAAAARSSSKSTPGAMPGSCVSVFGARLGGVRAGAGESCRLLREEEKAGGRASARGVRPRGASATGTAARKQRPVNKNAKPSDKCLVCLPEKLALKGGPGNKTLPDPEDQSDSSSNVLSSTGSAAAAGIGKHERGAAKEGRKKKIAREKQTRDARDANAHTNQLKRSHLWQRREQRAQQHEAAVRRHRRQRPHGHRPKPARAAPRGQPRRRHRGERGGGHGPRVAVVGAAAGRGRRHRVVDDRDGLFFLVCLVGGGLSGGDGWKG